MWPFSGSNQGSNQGGQEASQGQQPPQGGTAGAGSGAYPGTQINNDSGNPDPTNVTPGQDPNSVAAADAKPTTDALDMFGKMFDNQDSGDSTIAPTLALGKESLDKVVGQLDFMSGIDQAQLDQLQGGDLSVLPAIMNAVAKQAYSTSMQHNSALVNDFVGKRSEYDSQRIAPAIKSSMTQSKLDSDLGDFGKHPAMKAQMTETAQRLSKAYPDASSEWIVEQSKTYMTEIAARSMGITVDELQNIKSQQQTKTQEKTAKDVDWDDYFAKG